MFAEKTNSNGLVLGGGGWVSDLPVFNSGGKWKITVYASFPRYRQPNVWLIKASTAIEVTRHTQSCRFKGTVA
jgi:hypothetical protein